MSAVKAVVDEGPKQGLPLRQVIRGLTFSLLYFVGLTSVGWSTAAGIYAGIEGGVSEGVTAAIEAFVSAVLGIGLISTVIVGVAGVPIAILLEVALRRVRSRGAHSLVHLLVGAFAGIVIGELVSWWLDLWAELISNPLAALAVGAACGLSAAAGWNTAHGPRLRTR